MGLRPLEGQEGGTRPNHIRRQPKTSHPSSTPPYTPRLNLPRLHGVVIPLLQGLALLLEKPSGLGRGAAELLAPLQNGHRALRRACHTYIYAFPYTLTALLFPSRNFLQSRSGPSDMAVSSDTALTSIAQYKAQHSPKQGTALPSIAQYQGKHSPMQG